MFVQGQWADFNLKNKRIVAPEESKIAIFNQKFEILIPKNTPGCIFKANGKWTC